jgi:hypothetical protein
VANVEGKQAHAEQRVVEPWITIKTE